MSLWVPGFVHKDLGPDGGPFDRHDAPKLVWHTWEGTSWSGAESAFADYPPHIAVNPADRGRRQYVSLDRHAYALRGSDSEDSWVIQVEVAGFADDTHTWPDAWLDWLGEAVLAPILELVPIPPTVVGYGFHGADEGMVLASPDSPIRFPSVAHWDGFAGHVGHQHAPAPDEHWDPGRLDVARIIRASGHDDQEDWLTMATLEDVKRAVRQVLNEGTASGQQDWAGTCRRQLGLEQENYNQLARLQETVDNLADELGAPALETAGPPEDDGPR